MVLGRDTLATAQLASTLGTNFAQAEEFARSLALTAEEAQAAIEAIQQLTKVKTGNARIQKLLQDELGTTSEAYKKLAAAARQGLPKESLFSPGGIKGIVSGLGQIGLAFGAIDGAINAIKATAGPAYDLLIGKNEKLNQQLLSAQAGLVASNQVTQGGIPIVDPTEAIKALNGPMRQALEQVQQDSLELVGVTSGDLTEAFEVLISKASVLANQSKEFADPIEAAGKLTIDFAATLGTLGLGMQQARQEIGAILSGTIDSNAQLSRSLNITNAQVASWRAQGVLVDKLRERMSAFTQANALGARSISGITSNLRDVLEVTARVAGEPLLEPVIASLEAVYKLVSANKDGIQAAATAVTDFLLQLYEQGKAIAEAIAPAVGEFAKAFGSIASGSGQAVASLLLGIAKTAVVLVKAIAPALTLVAKLVASIASLVDTPIGEFVIQMGLLSAAIVTIAPVVAGIPVAIAGIATAAGAATTGLGAMATAAAAAMAPLLPIIAAGGVLLLTVKYQQLEDNTEALESYRRTSEQIGQEAIAVQEKLAALQRVVDQGGTLSPEQIKQRDALQTQAQQLGEAYKSLNADIKSLQPANDAQANAQAAAIAGNERMAQSLEKVGGGVEVQARAITNQGSIYQQLTAKADNAFRTIQEGAQGSADDLNKAAESAVELTQQQFQAGFISREEAQKRLQQLQEDGRLELGIRQSAQEALNEIVEDGTSDRVRAVNQEMNAVQAAVSRQELTEATGQQRITQLKREQLQIQLEAVEAAIEREAAARQKGIDQQIAALDTQIAAAQAALATAQGSGDADGAKQQQAEIDRLNAQRVAAQAASQGESERMQELKDQQSELQSSIADTEAETQRQQIAQQMAHYDNQQELLETAQAKGEISQAEFNERSLALTMQRLDAEAAEIARQRERLDPSDTAGQEALTAKLADVQERRITAERDYFDRRLQLMGEHYDNEQQILDGSIAQGLMSETEYNQQSLSLTMERLNAELAAIQEQRSRLGANQTEDQERLAAKEAEIYERRAQAQQAFYQAQIATVERAQQEATDRLELSRIERETQLQEMINSGQIREEEAASERLELQREALDQQLAQEQNYRAELEALPPSSDPRIEAERQAQIRGSRLETARITQRLAENERAQQEEALRLYEAVLNRQVQAIQNRLTAESQALDRRTVLQEAVSASLDRQVQLLEAQRNLQDAITGAVSSELGILSSLARNRREQQQIAQVEAAIRLRTLAIQQQQELEVLRIKREQAAIEREKEAIALRMRAIQNQSDTAQAAARLSVVQRDPTATPEEVEAARLEMQGTIDEGNAIRAQFGLLQEQAALDERVSLMEEQALRTRQRTEQQQARFEFAQTLTGRERRQATEEIRSEIFGGFGAANARDFRRGGDALTASTLARFFDNAGSPQAPDPQGSAIANNLLNRAIAPQVAMPATQAALPQAPLSPQQEVQEVVNRIVQLQEVAGVLEEGEAAERLAQTAIAPVQQPQLQIELPQQAVPTDIQLQPLLEQLQTLNNTVQVMQTTLETIDGLTIENQSNQIINQFEQGAIDNGDLRERLNQQILDIQYETVQGLARRSRS